MIILSTHCIVLSKTGIKEYKVMIDGRNVWNQSVKIDIKTYGDIIKIATSQVDVTQLAFY